MVAKHTPGPWVFCPAEIEEDGSVYPARIDGGSRELVICYFADMASDAMCESTTDIRSKAANARLIAAAPDLLAVAKMMLATDDEWKALSMDERARVEAAIAKAEGDNQ